MNRKQRRVMERQGVGVSPTGAARAQPTVPQLFGEGVRHQHLGKFNEAARLYKQVLELAPDHAEASNNLGCVLLAQGKPKEARPRFERALILVPQLLDDFASIVTLLVSLNPAVGEGMKRAAATWPQRLPVRDLLGASGVAALTSDSLLLRVLQSTMVRDVDLERMLTSMRLQLLQIANESAAETVDGTVVDACCVLARQCFINEYVFAVLPDEAEQADALRAKLVDSLPRGTHVPPQWVAAVAMYVPLHSLPGASTLLEREWSASLDEVITQQVREPAAERQYRDGIPRLTAISDAVSMQVRGQYEEHPYPRWVHAASVPAPTTIDEHLRSQFPTAAFSPLGARDGGIDILVAGCGTGRHPIEVALKYRDARVLALDLSLASLCYAKRKTPEALVGRISYGQADILEVGTIGRLFDVIDAGGVLHHLADPFVGWRELLSLLRPGGFMRVALYSELARRDVVAARAFIAKRGYQPTVEGIRLCRQELLGSPVQGVAKAGDFFSTSECRDLLFHVQECRMAIPQIKAFLGENDLRFIGFEFAPRVMEHYRAIFGSDSMMRDLDRWHAFETARPDTFVGMYQFWLQKS
jgi:2-polyprenyl-3-methyl-5-hydroxy-6-metoxy-1,4-benzoquinol methylase/tetratricopeptide (TPR) repeat protein